MLRDDPKPPAACVTAKPRRYQISATAEDAGDLGGGGTRVLWVSLSFCKISQRLRLGGAVVFSMPISGARFKADTGRTHLGTPQARIKMRADPAATPPLLGGKSPCLA